MRRALRRQAVLALALGLLGAPGRPSKAAEPGDLIAVLPSSAPGPVDIAYDPEEGAFWVTSFTEHRIYRFTLDLKEAPNAIPLPFQNLINSFAGGIAYDPGRRTLFVADMNRGLIHEIERDGTPTGRVLAVPSLGTPYPALPFGMSFDSGGDGGRGSL